MEPTFCGYDGEFRVVISQGRSFRGFFIIVDIPNIRPVF